ncbi:MAG UNVERIFIED_CONTAM: HD domain-containing protein [Planctomycetaceae bacterium]
MEIDLEAGEIYSVSIIAKGLQSIENPHNPAGRFRKAFEVSVEAHKDMRRKSGEPYIYHPLAVAKIAAEARAEPLAIVCALLHDTVEDTYITLDDVLQNLLESSSMDLLKYRESLITKTQVSDKNSAKCAHLQRRCACDFD